MLTDINFANNLKNQDGLPLAAFAYNTVSQLRVKTHIGENGSKTRKEKKMRKKERKKINKNNNINLRRYVNKAF